MREMRTTGAGHGVSFGSWATVGGHGAGLQTCWISMTLGQVLALDTASHEDGR